MAERSVADARRVYSWLETRADDMAELVASLISIESETRRVARSAVAVACCGTP